MFVPSEVNVEELISKYQIKSKRNFYLKKDYNNAKEKIIYFVSEGFIFNKKILQESDIKTDILGYSDKQKALKFKKVVKKNNLMI